jgi:hypothetical protein
MRILFAKHVVFLMVADFEDDKTTGVLTKQSAYGRERMTI